ncbi:LamG domain-containing protein [Laspinema sp. A4]|uniref:LamG domain-containing protein n=1 Tax=Laspinema sp. D2d TaxID=2953686 RepID=UPI0021BAD349|nr:LamG domain-containing protein [Laspinema sp. D2d]MCT7982140.1 LamG domain-containing protein [Laspinema sp. D2d]
MIFNNSVAVPPTVREINLGYSYPEIPLFNGSSDWIEIPYSGDFNPPQFTVELWVDYQGGIGYRAILTSVCSSAQEGRRGYLFCVNPAGNWQFWVGSGQPDAPWVILTGPRASKGIWTHLAASYNEASQTLFFYIDGSVVAQRSAILFHPNKRNSLRVGAGATEQSGASPCFFQGRITQIRVWNSPLVSADIATLSSQDLSGDRQTLTPSIVPSLSSGVELSPIPPETHTEPDVLLEETPPGIEEEIGQEEITDTEPDVLLEETPPGIEEEKIWQEEITDTEPDVLLEETPPGIEEEIGQEEITDSEPDVLLEETPPRIEEEEIWDEEITDTEPDVLLEETPPGIEEEEISNEQNTELELDVLLEENPPRIEEEIGKEEITDIEPDVLLEDTLPVRGEEKIEEPPEVLEISLTLEEPEPEVVPSAKSFQSALMFNGINSSVEVKNPFKNNRTFTLSLWVKPSLMDQGWCGVFSNDSGEHLPPLELGIAPKGGLYYDSFDAAGTCRYHDTLDGFFENADRWVHIAWVKAGTEYQFYRNGELYAIQAAPDRFYLGQSQALIGMGENGFAGAIRDVRVWKVARTAAEIRHDLHRLLTGEEPGLSHYWAFNDGNGAIASDGAKCANRGNMIGATWGQGNPPRKGDNSLNEGLRPVLCFARETNYIEVDDPFENDTTFTISLWLQPAIAGPTPYGIMGKRWWPSAFKPELWGIEYQQTLYYHTSDSSSPNQRHAAPLLNFFSGCEGDWVHLTWVKAGTEYRFYRNGTLFATQVAPERFYTDNTSYWFGKLGIGNSVSHFRGQMADIQVWSVALSEEQIQQHLQEGVTGEEPGLRYYWPLNEGEGTWVQDIANPPHPGKIRGATWQIEEVAIALPEPESPLPHFMSSVLTFDGEDDAVILPELGAINRTFTLSLWVKPATLNDERWHGIFSKGGKEADQLGLALCPCDRALQYHSLGLGEKTPNTHVLLNFFETGDRWVHITWVKAGSLYHVYRNGEWFATQPAPEQLEQTPGDYCLGKSQVFANRDGFFAGQIAEVRLWNVARTEAEIHRDFTHRLQGNELGLTAYYPLNEGSGDWVGDRGRILGATWEQMEIPIR